MLAALPLPTRTFPVLKMSEEEERKATTAVVAIGIASLLACLFVWRHSAGWGVAFGIVGALLIVGAFGKKTLVTKCPFCGAKIGGILNQTTLQTVRCGECFEYSNVESGRIKALDAEGVSPKRRYWSPVFEGGTWPDACAECGAPASRRDSISDGTVNALALGIGLAMIQRASLANIPYSNAHKGAVELSYSQTKKMDLKWQSLHMMRHYLALNRDRPMLGSKTLVNP